MCQLRFEDSDEWPLSALSSTTRMRRPPGVVLRRHQPRCRPSAPRSSGTREPEYGAAGRLSRCCTPSSPPISTDRALAHDRQTEARAAKAASGRGILPAVNGSETAVPSAVSGVCPMPVSRTSKCSHGAVVVGLTTWRTANTDLARSAVNLIALPSKVDAGIWRMRCEIAHGICSGTSGRDVAGSARAPSAQTLQRHHVGAQISQHRAVAGRNRLLLDHAAYRLRSWRSPGCR